VSTRRASFEGECGPDEAAHRLGDRLDDLGTSTPGTSARDSFQSRLTEQLIRGIASVTPSVST
jgi:hypothetical protein